MELKLLERFNREMELNLPERDNMDDYLDTILPKIRPWGEDLYEGNNYLYKRWLEIRDDEAFHESVLHIFNDGGEYMLSIDGNIQKGVWRFLPESNTFILEYLGRSELFDLAFLNSDFFILRKHGDQHRKGQKKYFVLGRENAIYGLTWREIMEVLFNIYRGNTSFLWQIIGVIVVAAIIIGLSLR